MLTIQYQSFLKTDFPSFLDMGSWLSIFAAASYHSEAINEVCSTQLRRDLQCACLLFGSIRSLDGIDMCCSSMSLPCALARVLCRQSGVNTRQSTPRASPHAGSTGGHTEPVGTFSPVVILARRASNQLFLKRNSSHCAPASCRISIKSVIQ